MQHQDSQKKFYSQYIALDWAKDVVAISHQEASGTRIKSKLMSSEVGLVRKYIQSLPGTKILTIEETTTSHWLYVELSEVVQKIIVCDPFHNSLLKEGPKTDKIDSTKLLMLLRSGMLKEVFHSMEKTYEIRKLVSSYVDIVQSMVRLKNQRSAIFRSEGEDHKKQKILSDSKIKEFITVKQIETIKYLEELQKEYEMMFVKIAKNNKVIRRLDKVPGIGPIISVVVYCIVIDAKRFETKHKYYSYCGSVKHKRESGNRTYGKKNARHNKVLKYYYKLATKSALRGDNDVRGYYEHLLQKHYTQKKAQLKITQYLQKVTYAIMKNDTDYRPYQWRENIKTS